MSASRVRTLLLLHVLLLFYSLADVASKFAAGYELFSLGFIVCYALVLVVLAGYALGWQQVIKRMPLTAAYANRGITVVWGLFWGAVLFGEAITPFKVIGAVMIIAGIALFSHADAEESTSGESLSPRETDFPREGWLSDQAPAGKPISRGENAKAARGDNPNNPNGGDAS